MSVVCKINVPIGRYKTDPTDRPPLLRWQKATIDIEYIIQLLADVGTKSLCDQLNCMDSVSDIDKLNTPTTDLLLTASYETHKAVRDKWKLWINEGMPRKIQHKSFRNYKAAKRLVTHT